MDEQGTIAGVSFQPMPIDLVAALPELPFDVYVVRHGRMVLYATRGTPSGLVVARARAGLDVRSPVRDAPAARRILLTSLIRDLERGGARDAGAGHAVDAGASAGERIAMVLTALLAPLFGTEPVLDRDAFAAARAAVDVLAVALVSQPGAARAILGRHVEPTTLAGLGPARRWAGRALDAVVGAVSLAVEAGVSEGDLQAVARAAAFRDLGMPRILEERSRTGSGPRGPRSGFRVPRRQEAQPAHRHVARSLDLLGLVGFDDALCLGLIAEHHVRLDDVDLRTGRRGSPTSVASSVVALADVFGPLLSPESAAPAANLDEAIRRLHIVTWGHHDPAVVWHLVRLLATGRIRRVGRMATH